LGTLEWSRNDVIANVGVLVAALGVYWFASAWPDVLVGTAIAIVFLRSAARILRQALPQLRTGVPAAPSPAE
jgi:Co/Zn/Cd efflux system component